MSEPPDALFGDRLNQLFNRIVAVLEREPGLGGAAPGDSEAKPHAKPRQLEPSRLNDSDARVPITAETLGDALHAACVAVGIVDRDVPTDGRWHKTDIEGDPRGRGDGRIKLFPDGEGGIVCNWKSGEIFPFFATDGHRLTDAERRDRERKRGESIRLAQEELARRHAEAAGKAAEILEAATGDPAAHAYAIKKQVRFGSLVRRGPWPQRSWEDALLVPIYGGDGDLWSIEAINTDGDKDFLAGGRLGGGFHPFGEVRGAGRVLIGEGLASVAACVAAELSPAVAALFASNLKAVALARRGLTPGAEIILVADNDVKPDGDNRDLRAAEVAARAVGGRVAVPDLDGRKCDFWDLWQERGGEAVRDATTNAKTPPRGVRPGRAWPAVKVRLAVQRHRWSPTARWPAECIGGQVSSKRGVPGVLGVRASPGAGSSRNTRKKPGVPKPTEDPNPEAEDDASGGRDLPPLSDRPCFRVFDEWIEHPTGKLRPGVWFFGAKQARRPEDPATLTQQWVCSPLYIDAVTEDGQDNNFGRLLRFRNTLGRWREWAMPMELLRGFGDEMRGELLAMGVEIDPLSKTLLGQYLQSVHPETRVHCALQVGWCGDSFVLPDEVIGPGASGVIFQSGDHQNGEYTCAGTLDGWQSEVAARAVGNPLLV